MEHKKAPLFITFFKTYNFPKQVVMADRKMRNFSVFVNRCHKTFYMIRGK